MHDIFISHSSKDKDHVFKITEKLEENGLNFWISSHNIKYGTSYPGEIVKAIKDTKIFLILLSKNSYTSKHVKNEISIAFNENTIIIPILIDNSEIPDDFLYYLNRIHGIKVDLKDFEEFADKFAQELKGSIKNNGMKDEYDDKRKYTFNTKQTSSIKINENKYLTPRPKNRSDFIGRTEELKEINKKLEDENKLLIRGMGGMGKTEIAKKIFKNSDAVYDRLAWINYSGNLKESFFTQIKEEKLGLEFHEDDDIDKRFDDIVTKLCNMNEKTLLVIDDFDTVFDDDLYELDSQNLYIIITSRYKIEEYDNIYEIENLKTTECIQLFKKYYKNMREDEETIVKNIIELAGYHTLTIELIAKTAKASHKSLNEFYEILQDKGFNINDYVPEKTLMHSYKDKDNEKKRFFDHLKIVFDLSNLSEQEKNILLNISMLPSTHLNIVEVKDWLGLPTYDELNELCDKGWLQVLESENSEDGEFEENILMHNLIQETVRAMIPFEYQKIQNLVKAMISLTNLSPVDNPYIKRKYADYGASISKNCLDENYDIAYLLHNIATIYSYTANIDTAEKYIKKAVDLKQLPTVKATSMNLASSYNNLSAIVLEKGDPQKAVRYGRKAIDIVKSMKNESHPNYAKFCNNISVCFYYSEELRFAKNYSKIAVKSIGKFYEQNSPELLKYYSSASMIFSKAGDVNYAIDFAEKCESIIKEHFNEKHPVLAKFHNRLSETYINLSDFDRATTHFETAIMIGEELLDKEDSELGRIYYNGFRIQKELNNLLKEEEYLEKALLIKEKWYGSKNSHLVKHYDEMCQIYAAKEEKQKELEYVLKALSIVKSTKEDNKIVEYYEKALSLLDPEKEEDAKKIKELSNELSSLYLKQKAFDKAIEYKLNSTVMEEKQENADNTTLFTLNNDLSELYNQKEDFKNAAKYKQKAIDYLEGTVDINKHQLISHYNEIIKLCQKTKDNELTLHYLLKSKDILEKTNSKSEMAAVYRNISHSYQQLGNLHESLAYMLKSLELWKTLQNQKSVASSLKKISDLYKEQKRFPEAKEHLFQALNIIESNDTKKKKQLNYYYNAMIELLEEMGDLDEAKKFKGKILG